MLSYSDCMLTCCLCQLSSQKRNSIFFLSHPPACKWAPCGSWFAPPQPWYLRRHLGWLLHGVALCWVGGGARVFEWVDWDKVHSPTMRLAMFSSTFSWQWNEQRRGGWELFPACALKWAQHVWLHWLGAGASWWARQNHEVDDNGLCAETRTLLQIFSFKMAGLEERWGEDVLYWHLAQSFSPDNFSDSKGYRLLLVRRT